MGSAPIKIPAVKSPISLAPTGLGNAPADESRADRSLASVDAYSFEARISTGSVSNIHQNDRAQPEAALDGDWSALADVLSLDRVGLGQLLSAFYDLSPNPEPMSPGLAHRFCEVLCESLSAQLNVWCAEATLGASHGLEPHRAMARLAQPVRYLVRADAGDTSKLLTSIERAFNRLAASGIRLHEKALRETAFSMTRLRYYPYGAKLGPGVSAVLNAMVPHLRAVGPASERGLAAWLAALVNHERPSSVDAFIRELERQFLSLDPEARFGCVFIRTALRGVTNLPPGPGVESILYAIAEHLEDRLLPADHFLPAASATPCFIAGAMLDLEPHLATPGARLLACKLVTHTLGPGNLPKESFANPESTEQWMCGMLRVSSAANSGKVDLHGMSHRLARFFVGRVIRYAMGHLSGTNRLNIVFGAASHQRANEGVMLAVVEKVLSEMSESFPGRIDEVERYKTSLEIRVRGRPNSYSESSQASSTDSLGLGRSTNRFEFLRTETEGGALESGSSESIGAVRRPRRARKKRGAGGHTAPSSPRETAARPPAPDQAVGLLSWFKSWVGAWFRPNA